MGLLDAYNEYKVRKAQIPEIAALPQPAEADISKAYSAALGKEYTVPTPASAGDIVTSATDAYRNTGGGIKGAGLAVLAGLGKAGEFLNTETGSKIAAGLSSNPYVAQGYMANAGSASARQAALADTAFKGNIERMKQLGDSARTESTNASAEKRAAEDRAADDKWKAVDAALKDRALSADERYKAIDAALKAQGIAMDEKKLRQAIDEFNARQTQSADKDSMDTRGWLTKALGIGPLWDSVKPVTINPSISIGTERNGYVYQGGDPGDKNSWRKI